MTSPPTVTRAAADIGGTFTDVAVLTPDGHLATRKLPSTPNNYADAVIAGVRSLLEELESPLDALEELLHGCTVATNAILEGRGAPTALLTTRGFRDVLELRRVRVPNLYEPLYERPPPLVPRQFRFEIDERTGPRGEALRVLDEGDVRAAAERIRAAGIEAVAVCYLHSYANPAHEQRTGEILREMLPGAFVSLSVDVLPQKLEYERTSTTVINAYVGPPVKHYVQSMVSQVAGAGIGGRLMVMQSSGGILDADAVAENPARIVECGPAAGVVGAQHFAARAGFDNLITLDMGGTTAKASLIERGSGHLRRRVRGGRRNVVAQRADGRGRVRAQASGHRHLGGWGRRRVDRVARQGRIAQGGPAERRRGTGSGVLRHRERRADGDRRQRGPRLPQSGVACRGERAHPVRARARGGSGRASRAPLRRDVVETAFGIHTVANANMMKAVKAVTTYRGRDPRDFTIIAFGGSGGVHAVDLARVLQVRRVVLPVAAGVFSALGLLFSNLEMNETVPFLHLAEDAPLDEVERRYAALAERIAAGGGR